MSGQPIFQGVIQNQRNAALDILKPSKRDLEHGLELHQRCLVFESYGLPPKAPVSSQVLTDALNSGAPVDEVLDSFDEMSHIGWAVEEDLRNEYMAAWNAAGVDAVLINSGQESNQPLRLLKRFARFSRLVSLFPEFIQFSFSVDAIQTAKSNNKRSLCPSFCGVPLAGRFENVSNELSLLSTFAHLGVRAMHLTYNRRNPLGDGCGEANDGGVSDFGAAAIREMNRVGIIVDIAHCGERTSFEAAQISDFPVMISHSACYELNAHARNKTDKVIGAVIDSGGTMGITNIPPFLGGAGNITSFLDHIDYVAKKFGVDAITIGTDRSYYSCKFQPFRFPRMRQPWEHLWPPSPIKEAKTPDWQQSAAMQTLAWTNWPLFTVGLVQRGYSDQDIEKILGGNMLRVAKAVWKTSFTF